MKPAWGGPTEDGISQSMLCSYLSCKQRFHVKVIEGLEPVQGFSAPLEFGNYFHIASEHFERGDDWLGPIEEYCQELLDKYPFDSESVVKWFKVTECTFPEYVDYWSQNEDVLEKIPVSQEEVFCINYELPSGRIVKMRGMFDGVDTIDGRYWLQENKTMTVLSVESILRRLTFDIQTNYYKIALEEKLGVDVAGVRYNCVKRPLSGGKGAIRQRKATSKRPAETSEEYYSRLVEDYIRDDPAYYFQRFSSEVSSETTEAFKEQFLHPVLENLLDDYEWWNWCSERGDHRFNYTWRGVRFPNHTSREYRLPFGVYNRVMEKGQDDVDDYMDTGSDLGLEKVTTFFPELER